MMQHVKLYWQEFIHLFNEMSPYLMLGFLFAGLLYVFLPKHRMQRYLGKRNFGSVLNASLLGIPLPLCSCGVIPTGVSFYQNGASKGATTSFLISTPQTGIDSILVTYSLLGWPLALIRPFIALFTGIAGGMTANIFTRKREQSVTSESAPAEPLPKGFLPKTRRMFRYAFVEFLQDIALWLVIGLAIAALIAVLLPDDFFTRYIGNDYLSMLLVLAASIPLYVCATGSVPIAAVLLMKGLSPGAAIVFLMAGPATNVATMTVIGKTMGRKALFIYLASIVGGAIVFGALVNELIPREFFMKYLPAIHGEGHEGAHLLPLWLSYASTIVLSVLIIHGLARNYLPGLFKKKKTSNLMQKDMIKKYSVEGMTCNHCKATVENGLKSIPEIANVEANPASNEVFIDAGDVPEEQIKATVEKLGYKFKGKKE